MPAGRIGLEAESGHQMETRPYRADKDNASQIGDIGSVAQDMGIEQDHRSVESDVRLLKSQAVDLITELEDINLRQNPIIAAEYQVKIGCWQIELLRARLNLAVQKHEKEIVQQDLEEGRGVDIDAALAQAAEETHEQQSELAIAIDGYFKALEYRSTLHNMSERELARIKSLFRKLVARFHPNLHPGSEWAGKLFSVARSAYRNGETEMLESMEVATRSFEAYDLEPIDAQSEDDFEVELVSREAQVSVLENLLESLKKAKPYCYKTMLENPRMVEQEVQALKTQIDACESTTETYRRHLVTMVERSGYGGTAR